MAVEKIVAVRFISKGSKQVGAQVLAMGNAHQTAAKKISAANAQVASASRGIAAVSGIAGKAILLGVGAAFAVSAKAAIDFESSMAGVAKTLSGDFSADQITELGEDLREMSLTVPTNVNQLAGIAESGGQLGVDIEDMEHFTRTVAALGVTTNLSFEQAAKGLARFSNILQIPIKNIDVLGNVIVDLGNNFATTESEILNFGIRLAPIGKTVGLTEQEILGLAAAFSSLGIPAERGGTALQRVFIDISRAVDAGGSKLKEFAKTAGVSAEEFAAMSAADQFTSFVEGLRRIQDEGGSASQALKRLNINQQRTIQVLLAASGAAGTLADGIDRANSATDDNNALWDEAARRYGTTSSEIQLMVNAFNDLRIEIGGAVVPVLKSVMKWMQSFFQALKNNVPTLKGFALVLGVLVGVKGFLGLVGALGKAVAAYKVYKAGVAAAALVEGASVARIGAMKVAMASLAGAIGLVVLAFVGWFAWQANVEQKAKELEKRVTDLNDALEEGTSPVQAWSSALGDVLTPKAIDFLHAMGVSVDDLTTSLAAGDGSWAAYFEDFTNPDLLDQKNAFAQAEGIFAVLDESARNGATNTRDWLDTIGGYQTDTYRDLVIGRQRLSDELTKINEFDVAVGLDQEQRKTEAVLSGEAERVAVQQAALEELDRIANERREIHFQDRIDTLPEEQAEMWENFNETVDDALAEHVDMVDERFADIKESVFDGVGLWDEYGEAVVLNLEDSMAAMDARLLDSQEWIGTLAAIMQKGVSGDTISFFEDMELADKAAFTRLLKENPALFNQYVTDVEQRMDGFRGVVAEQAALEGFADKGLEDLFATILEGASELELNGIPPVEAFGNKFNEVAESMEPGMKQDFLDFAEAIGPELLASWFNVGVDIIIGLINGMESQTGSLETAAARLARHASLSAKNELSESSPSKVFHKIGADAALGMEMGLNQGMMNMKFGGINNMVGGFRQATFARGSGETTSSVTNNSPTTVQVIDSHTNDLRNDISAGLIAGGVTRQVETLVR